MLTYPQHSTWATWRWRQSSVPTLRLCGGIGKSMKITETRVGTHAVLLASFACSHVNVRTVGAALLDVMSRNASREKVQWVRRTQKKIGPLSTNLSCPVLFKFCLKYCFSTHCVVRRRKLNCNIFCYLLFTPCPNKKRYVVFPSNFGNNKIIWRFFCYRDNQNNAEFDVLIYPPHLLRPYFSEKNFMLQI